jgi:hypothetical protein
VLVVCVPVVVLVLVALELDWLMLMDVASSVDTLCTVGGALVSLLAIGAAASDALDEPPPPQATRVNVVAVNKQSAKFLIQLVGCRIRKGD